MDPDLPPIQLTSMIEGTWLSRGTASRRRLNCRCQLRGKTGTTNDAKGRLVIWVLQQHSVAGCISFRQSALAGRGASMGRYVRSGVPRFMSEAIGNMAAAPFEVPPVGPLYQN